MSEASKVEKGRVSDAPVQEAPVQEAPVQDEYQYRDPRRVVRYLRDRIADGLARELAGLNEGNAVDALIYAEDLLGNALSVVRLCLSTIEVDDDDDAGD